MKRRILCFVLSLVMIFSLFPALFNTPANAATTSQNNIVARADYFYNLTWTAQSTVYGWNYNYTFYAGSTYRVPYGQPINSGAYVGYYVSIEDFLTAANTAGSVFYTSRSTYSSTSSVYYATDCSAFVSWCWGVDRKTTYSIPQISTYIGMATAANAYSLQLGDCLNSNDVGHVVLVTDLVYSGSTLTSIEITEQTPPQMKRSYYTPSELGSKYGTYYGIYRYSGEVPAAPDGSTNDDSGSSSTGSTTTITSKYYPACDSSYTSLYDAFASIGVTLTWELQTQIASKNGITSYTGTVDQNNTLLSLLKAGTLLNPNYVPVSYYPACSSSAATFYEGMSEIGVTCDWTLHTEIAAANGITNFSGTAEENTTLLNLLKAGKLIIPGTGSADDSGSSGNTGSSVVDGKTGYDRGYAGGMAGTGEYKAFGLDVSSWQGASLDFNRIKNAGYDYVILRAGTSNGKDECFETYYQNAKAAGLDVGAYYYSYATSVSAVQADMEDFLSYIDGKTYEYPIYFDYEDSTQQALSSSLSQQICLTAMDMLAAEGYLVGMYTGKYFSTLLPMETICAKYEVWIAHYLAVGDGTYDGTGDYWKYGPTYASQYGMYQFTDSVWINGYGPYDGDVCYKDYPTIVKTYGFNGYTVESSEPDYIQQNCTFYPAHCTIEVTTANNLYTEPRSASDVIEAAPLGTTYVANGLYVNGGGNLWYRVTTSSGDYGYIYSGRVKYVDQVTADVTVTDYDLPSNHVVGNVFVVNGNISSTYNKLGNVSVYIYSGNTTSGTPVTGDSAASSNNKYSLSGSTIDDGTSFGDLATGTYTYVISADYTNYYAASTKELATNTGTIKLVTHVFSVVTEGSSGGTTDTSYFDKCTFYPSRVKFKTNRDTGIFSEPRTAKTGNTSVQLEDAPNGTTYTSTGLYVNSGGNIFYQVLTSDGQKGYIYSGYTDFVKKAYDDIKLSGADLPNGHVKGDVFLVTGTISSSYNTLGTAKVYIYSGFGVDGDPVTGGTDSVTDNRYVLDSSDIDNATSFGDLPVGTYTYYIGVTFESYYAESAKVLGTVSGTRTLKKHYFTVIKSSVDQDSCTHSNTETIIEAPTCTATGTKVTSCSICGLTEKGTAEALGHSYGSYTVTVPATCTTAGSKEKTCTACGKVYTKAIAATGHSYTVETIAGTCTEYASEKYTCSSCGDTYTKYAGEYSDWQTTKPSVDASLIESKTQYRYKDYSTLTSYEANLSGYTLVSSTWEQTGTGKVTYVKSWPSGFPTSSSTYATYNKIGDKVTASETETNKTEINSDSVVGYLWYHWCSYGGDTSTSYETNTNWCFHVFYSTTTPSQADNYDSSDGSYKLASSTQCAYCVWYWPVAVYEQNYTTYQNQFTYEKWSDWSSWSDEPVTTSDTRTVETRTVYRYIDAQLGDHTWNSGKVTTAATCTVDGVKTYTCTACSATKTESIEATGHSWNAANCTQPKTCATCGKTSGSSLGHSYTSKVTTEPTCTANGVRTYTCSTCSNSYTESIAKLGHSYGSVVTAPTCTEQGYTTHTCATCGNSYKDSYTNASGHSYTSKVTTEPTCTEAGVRTYSCSKCSDSYTEMISAIEHKYASEVTKPTCIEGGYTKHTCANCGNEYTTDLTNALGHSYVGTTCTTCGHVRDYYLIGYINGADYGCNGDGSNLGDYKFTNGQVTVSFTSDSYVFVKTGDNLSWYMTQSFCTEKNATLYSTSNGATEKMFVPGGTTITFTLVVNNDETLVLSYNIDNCEHTYETTTVEGTCVTGGTVTYTCTKCGYSYTETTSSVGHNYVGGKCVSCGDTKVVSINGTFNEWAGTNMTWTENGYTFSIDLAADTYEFKLVKDGTWLGNYGEIYDTTTTTSDIGWEFVDAGNCKLIATGGTYYFTFHYDTNMLVIEYVHVHAHKAGDVVAPTCTEKGYTVYTCACGDSYHGDEKAALDHNYSSEVTTAATCTDDGVRTFTCSRCSDSYTEAITKLGHDYKTTVTAPTCTAEGYTTHTCSRCSDSYKDSYKDALNHSYTSQQTKDPTCEDAGETTYTCSRCGHSYTEEISKLGHDYKATVTAPTCTAEGYTTHTCSRCSDSYKDSYKDALNHSYTSQQTKAPTCENAGETTFTCSKCGHSYTEPIEKLGHDYKATVTAPTCTAEGYTTHTCSRCDDSYKDSFVDMLGHSYSEQITTAPGCESVGTKTFTCANCSHSYTEEIAAIGHNYVGGKCGNCGDTKVVSINGTFNDWAGDNMTWTENGYTFTVKLDAGTYLFKLVKDGVWLGNNGSIEDTTTKTSDMGWEFVDAGDCTLIATGGTYTFTFNFDTNMLVIEFVHTHAYKVGEVVAPTCTAEGYTVYICACGDSENRDVKAALGHSWTAATCETAKTCSVCKATEGEPNGHNYLPDVTDPNCTEIGYTTWICTVCGHSYIDNQVEALGHSWINATCTTPKTCSNCGEIEGEKLGHNYISVVTDPECLKDGYTTHTCDRCGDSYKDSYVTATGHKWIDATCTEPKTCSACGKTSGKALGHDYTSVVTAPGCTTEGYTTHTCNRCNHTYTDGTVSPIGHSWIDSTCTEPITCSNCGTTIGEPAGHDYEAIVTPPTCTENGYTTYICTICDDRYVDDIVASNGHKYTEEITKAATCTDTGVKTFTCACGDSYTEEIASTGHSYEDVVTAPGCTTQGYTTHTCSVCGDSYVDSYTDPTGHAFVDGICECGKYALQHVGATLTLESEVKYNLYFKLNDPTVKLENVGLLTFLTEPSDATIDNASFVLNNLFYDSVQGYNALRTQGVPAKEMGDTMYLRLYATLDDGTVIYGKLIPYSAKTFATSILEKSSDEALKNTVVALMNYGAEAQKLLDYKTDSLMNADIPAEYQDKQVAYKADLLDGRVKAEDAKVGSLIATEGAFTGKNAQVTLNGALAINYLFVPGKTVDNGKMTMYFWTASTYSSVDVLTLDNADSTVDAVLNGSYYQAVYEGIAAKELDDTVYVLAVYESEGETCMSGVVSYSIEQFCRSQVTNGTANQALCEKLTIYSYYAKAYFGET